MKTEETYFFSDFTECHYREMLQLAKTRFKFRFYSDGILKDDNFILWRHDIDYSIQRAYALAKIEAEEQVYATYFVHLHNEYYNFFEKDVFCLLKRIQKLGHQVALHFDSHFYGINNEHVLVERLRHEKNIFEQIFQEELKVFSFHNTTPFTMNCKEWKYADLINTYAEFFQNNVEYCSDSNGYWRFKRLGDVLSATESSKLQILTHPEWWQSEVMSPWQKIQRCVSERARKNLDLYQSHLRQFKMKNIDWHGEVN